MSALIGVDTLIMTVVILLLAASWRLYQKRKYYRNVTTKLPTIFGIPFIGIVHMMLNVNKVYQKIGKGFDNLKASTCCIWVATTPYVLTVDPEVIKHITSSPEFLNKSKDLYTHFQNGVFSGLLVSPAKKWKADRKIINPFFAHNNLLSLIPTFNDKANNVKNKLARLAGQGEQKIFAILKECGLQLSLLTIMDMKLEESSETYTEIVEAFNVFIDHMEKDLLYSWLGLGFLSRTPQYNRILKYIQDLMRSLTKKHLAQQIESEAMNNFVENKQAMIDITIKALRQGIFNENQVDIEGFTMLAASYETSVGATYTCLLMLAMHPEIQERVFQEIRSVFPDGITSVEYDDLKKLPYLDMFISEALRIAPPGPYIGRQTVDDTELYPGVMLPKDAQVLIPIYELHRRKELWGPEASRFNPDNFLPENIAKRHPYSYMPFSKGSRNCIGFRYAEISIRIILIHAVRNLKFSTTFKYEDIVYVPRVTLGYKIQPPVSIEARAN
ncbi:probable cytochrome P450 313a4 isoform X1 [Bactrocera oleae]|uniref:probable cytochrome P450 313a4 isoform X1 n=1 Tax=Bactrocera oleae TaxID=104688 RepID=UPI00387E7729